VKIFGREPALLIAIISGGLSLLVTFNIGLSTNQAGAIVAVISGVFAVITAILTRPIAPSAFTGLVAAVVVLLAAYHFNVSPETVGSVNAFVLAVLVFITRGQVSPASPTAPASQPVKSSVL
jgi:hypothetical protein